MIELPVLNDTNWPDEDVHFGFVITVSNFERQQLHVAALYRNSSGVLMIGDLQSHLRTGQEKAEVNSKFYWVKLNIDIETQQILAYKMDAWLELNQNQIPYSVASPGGILFQNDLWLDNCPGKGLTCATFLMALFDELSFPFINPQTWEKRETDDIWALSILEVLSKHMTKDHVEVQKKLIGKSIRIRPADIAAAGTLMDSKMTEPLCFKKVSPISKCIENTLLSNFIK